VPLVGIVQDEVQYDGGAPAVGGIGILVILDQGPDRSGRGGIESVHRRLGGELIIRVGTSFEGPE